VNALAVETKVVLVVEDDELFRRSLSGLVEALGYHVLCAESAEEALALSNAAHVDLLLTDYQLVNDNGLDLIRQLRSRGTIVPSVLISGFLSDDVKEEARGLAVTAILKKPSDVGLLTEMLPDLLGA
jgi:two-component system capsular synthesis sensor histidine kinase RcsC